ncbi:MULTISPECIES: hypothetical protein [unclassified Nodularia (in: cyanobacteria)]|uniref:hypothetical protein n=1 Tax=unclassified Nodularia (in: cyanobacteria) TaxID=2656917 RepID=UPI00187F03C9|nr:MULTISPECIES: hypothetical protein [unclassified Nodularia (in: cyanobacteria)]MBE9199530.1 hypothetical protein [Nodularia sp. LEGE 06071]MCC2691343.1 hypothetical protein [Nodularia sp. LEGE 04288]
MNTPSHAILNLVIFNQQLRDQASPAILIGAVLPDIPIFMFYLVMKFVYRLPEKQIWSDVYDQPFWQNIGSTLTNWGKGMLIAVNVFYLVGYYRFYLKS